MQQHPTHPVVLAQSTPTVLTLVPLSRPQHKQGTAIPLWHCLPHGSTTEHCSL